VACHAVEEGRIAPAKIAEEAASWPTALRATATIDPAGAGT
jgi:hypothetical protein